LSAGGMAPVAASAPAAPRAAPLRLRVNSLAGALCTVDADPDGTVADAKLRIAAAAGVPVSQQRLVVALTELEDDGQLLGSALRGASLRLEAPAEDEDGVEVTLVRRFPEQAEWLARARADAQALSAAPDHILADFEVIRAGVQQRGIVLQHASAALQADRQIVLEAVRQSGFALQHAAPALRGDPVVVLAAVRQCGIALRYAVEELRADPATVLAAVAQNGTALRYASQTLRGDAEVVMVAVRQRGTSLEYAVDRFRSDIGVVLAAVRQNGFALQYASEELRDSREVTMAAYQQSGVSLA